MEIGDDEREVFDFVQFYTGIRVEELVKKGKFKWELRSNKDLSDGIPQLTGRFRKYILAHEAGECTYLFSHLDEIKNYSGLKRLLGEYVGCFFAEFYFKKEIEKSLDKKYKIVREYPSFPLRYRIADAYVKKLLREKTERDQVIEIQKIIFREYPNTITFRVLDGLLYFLEKIGIM